MLKRKLEVLLFASALLGAVCSERQSPPFVPSAIHHSEYIDLRPGWRLRVVMPLGRSADYRLKFRELQTLGNSISVSADDFQGYETAYYSVTASNGGVRVRFASAEVTRDGISQPVSRSVLPLFGATRRGRFVRLVYLTRVSATDHNMAVIAGNNAQELEVLTKLAQANRCVTDARCSYIPAGIAVRPESQRPSDAVWAPVR